MKEYDVRSYAFLKKLCRDKCGRVSMTQDVDFEFHAFTSIAHRAGYGSVFGIGFS